MSFGRPLALLLLPAIAVLVWLYLRQPRGRTFVVPSLLLWTQVQDDVLHARRWRPDVSFLLRLLVLAAMIFGLAAPTRRAVEGVDRQRIVVLDASASMQATTAGSSRFERAVAAVRASVRPGVAESVVVLTSARRALRALAASRDPARVDAGLDALVPSDLPGGPAAGIALARQLAAASPLATSIEVFTDRAGAMQVAAQVEDASVEIFGAETRNVGIVGLHVQQGPFARVGAVTATVEVRNFGARDEHRSLTVEHQGKVLAREGFTLEPGGVRRLEVAGFAGAGVVQARLEPLDALTLDDRAFAWVAHGPQARLALLGQPPELAEQFKRLASAIGAQVEPEPTAAPSLQLGYGDVAAAPTTGNLLWVAPDAAIAGVAVGGWIDTVALVDWNDRHPALRGIVPSFAVPFEHVRELLPGAAAEVLLWGETAGRNVPLVLAVEEPRDPANGPARRQVLVAIDLARSGLLSNDDPGLALLTTGLLAWLLPDGGATSVPVGRVVEAEPGTTHVVLPSGASAPIDPQARGFELARAGLYRFVGPSAERVVVAHLADASESDLAGGSSGAAVTIPPAAAPPRRVLGDSSWARWAYLLATALLCLDWLWAARRREGSP